MDNLAVVKFGGSSLVDPEDVARIAGIMGDPAVLGDNQYRRGVIVVSAPGIPPGYKSDDSLGKKVTDMLKSLARECVNEQSSSPSDRTLFADVLHRFKRLSSSRGSDSMDLEDIDGWDLPATLEERLHEIPSAEENTASYFARVMAFGEEASARIIAVMNGFQFVDAADLFVLEGENFLQADVNREETYRRIQELNLRDRSIIIPGFYGRHTSGGIAIMGRGASDTTAAHIAAALHAGIYENFTDRVGVFAADPRLVPGAHVIPRLTYEEMRYLSYTGATILDAKAIEPGMGARVPIHIRSTFQYPEQGTVVTSIRSSDPEHPVVGVSYKGGLHYFRVKFIGLDDIDGILERLAATIRGCGYTIHHTTTGVDEVGYAAVPKTDQDRSNDAYTAIFGLLPSPAVPYDGDDVVKFIGDVGILTLVGKDMVDDVTMSPQITRVLQEAGVGRVFSTRPDSRTHYLYGIHGINAERALQVVY